MSKTKRSLKQLDRSCAWIREHWNATNLDVPDELLDLWMYERNEEQVDPTGFYLAVFSFGYLQHDLLFHCVPPGVMRSVSGSDLLESFNAWQLKLALARVHRVTELRMTPLPLFAFPKGETLRWTVAKPGDPAHLAPAN